MSTEEQFVILQHVYSQMRGKVSYSEMEENLPTESCLYALTVRRPLNGAGR